jgi:hypothetical protein
VRFGEATNPGPPGRETLEELRRVAGPVVLPIHQTYAGLPALIGVELPSGKRRLFAGTDIPGGDLFAFMAAGQLLPLEHVLGPLQAWLAARTDEGIDIS